MMTLLDYTPGNVMALATALRVRLYHKTEANGRGK